MLQVPVSDNCFRLDTVRDRSQGLTLPRAVVDIGDREFAAGLALVAFSRVQSLHGLVLARDINPARLQDVESLRARQAEEVRLATLARITADQHAHLLDDFERRYASLDPEPGVENV